MLRFINLPELSDTFNVSQLDKFKNFRETQTYRLPVPPMYLR